MQNEINSGVTAPLEDGLIVFICEPKVTGKIRILHTRFVRKLIQLNSQPKWKQENDTYLVEDIKGKKEKWQNEKLDWQKGANESQLYLKEKL